MSRSEREINVWKKRVGKKKKRGLFSVFGVIVGKFPVHGSL